MLLKGASMVETVRRVVVHLSKERSRPQRARFQQSIVDHFCAAQEDSLMVNCGLLQHRFLISDQEFAGSSHILLQDVVMAPAGLDAFKRGLDRFMEEKTITEIQDRGVDVGVAILLQSASREVLMTRRSKTLNIFPNVWVPPGGHIEPGEQLLDAGLRELQEETGLWLQDGAFSWRMLGLWESVYPPMLSRGLPKRHHIVIYLLLLSHESHKQLQMRLRPNEAEVSAYAWLAPQVLAAVAATQDGAPDHRQVSGDLPQTVRITELEGGSARAVSIPTAVFLNTAPAQGEDTERVSTGTKFALQLWLNAVSSQSE